MFIQRLDIMQRGVKFNNSQPGFTLSAWDNEK
jgi:hypothetical protein